MSGLELRLLGDFELGRGARLLPLPPSRKTRALLAYLCLQPRRFSREHLCQLLWDVPDDPRGSLRWSLSKIRALLDEDDFERVKADRNSVGVDLQGLSIDVLQLRHMVHGGLAGFSTEDLEAAATQWRGNALEGLEFCNYHDFNAWCTSLREQSVRDRSELRGELVRRLAGDPARALPHVRALVGLSPYDEAHRAALIRLLVAERKFGEAEEQFQLGLRVLKEAGVASSGALMAARRPPRIDAPPAREQLAVQAAAPNPSAQVPGLFGRDTELAVLHDTLQQVRQAPGCAVVLLSGAPGMGKSSLLAAARGHATSQGALVLEAAAFESGSIRPFALWLDGLRLLDPAVHDRVFGDIDVDNRDRLFGRLSQWVAEAAAKRPVVLLFDDLQWCDESSAAALHYVARMSRGAAVLGLLAARDGELVDNASVQQALRGLRRDRLLRELDVGPLPESALRQIIAARVPGADAERLSRECGGCPLLAVELARAELRGSTSGSLGDLVRERLSALGVVGAEVLHWAAVLSPRIDVGKIARAAGLDPTAVGAALEHAQRHLLLQATESGLAFAHELIGRAVYHDISPLRRQVMHRRMADLLEQDSAQDLARAVDLAHHASLSGDPGLAARSTVLAGRLCLRFFANDDAASLARKGLQTAQALPDGERVRIEIDLQEVLLAARAPDDWETAARHYAALAERALDHGALAHARLGYHMASWVRWTQGQFAAAREQTLQAARAVRDGQEEAQIIGMAETAKCLALLERDMTRADAMLMEAGALAQRKGFRHHAIAAGQGMLRFQEGRLDEAEESFRQARALCKSAGDRVNEYQANEFLVMLALQRGALAKAQAHCQDLLVLGDKLRGGSEEPHARAMAGLCRLAIDDQADELDAALADLRVADAKHRLAYVLTRAAMLDCERGRTGPAAGRATEALGYATLLERRTEMLIAHAVLAHACARSGDRSAYTQHAKEAERLRAAGAAAWSRDILARLANRTVRKAPSRAP